MNSRRSFIKKSLAGAALLAFPLSGEAFFKREGTRIVILHTSDLHSRIDPFPNDHPRYPGKGGFAQRAAQIQKIRTENEHVLLFDSGDILQGTPYFNFYKGQPEFELMSRMGYDETLKVSLPLPITVEWNGATLWRPGRQPLLI